MDSIISNIVFNKNNLSYAMIFKKIGKYYWNLDMIQKNYNTGENTGFWCIENCFQKTYKFFDLEDLLCFACIQNKFTVVKNLAEHNVNIHLNDNWPIRLAAINNNLEIIKYLVEKGADIFAKNNYALSWAVKSGYSSIVDYIENLKL